MFYDLAADTWGPEEHAAVERVLASRKVTMGPEVKASLAEDSRPTAWRWMALPNR